MTLNSLKLPLAAFFGEPNIHSSITFSIAARRDQLPIIHQEITLLCLYRALMFLHQKKPIRILFLNTNPEIKSLVKNHAILCDQYYVNSKWVGGTFTNWKQVSKSIRAYSFFETTFGLKRLEKNMMIPRFEKWNQLFEGYLTQVSLYHKKLNRSVLTFQRIHKQLNKPDLLIVMDPENHSIAIHEAELENIPVIAFVNAQSQTKNITYPIPGNPNCRHFIHFCLSWITAVSLGSSVG